MDQIEAIKTEIDTGQKTFADDNTKTGNIQDSKKTNKQEYILDAIKTEIVEDDFATVPNVEQTIKTELEDPEIQPGEQIRIYFGPWIQIRIRNPDPEV